MSGSSAFQIPPIRKDRRMARNAAKHPITSTAFVTLPIYLASSPDDILKYDIRKHGVHKIRVERLPSLLSPSYAQKPTGTPYTDQTSNISFSTWDIPGASGTGPLKFGLALPTSALETDATEFIGYLQCSPANGWCGISLGGSMTDSLLLVAYTSKETVKHSLRFTAEYALPGVYKGNATITPIRFEVNKESFTSIFRCKDCLHWSQNGTDGSAATSSGHLDLAYALSPETPGNSACPDDARFVQHAAQGTWLAFIDGNATSAGYDEWAGRAKDGGSGGC